MGYKLHWEKHLSAGGLSRAVWTNPVLSRWLYSQRFFHSSPWCRSSRKVYVEGHLYLENIFTFWVVWDDTNGTQASWTNGSIVWIILRKVLLADSSHCCCCSKRSPIILLDETIFSNWSWSCKRNYQVDFDTPVIPNWGVSCVFAFWRLTELCGENYDLGSA